MLAQTPKPRFTMPQAHHVAEVARWVGCLYAAKLDLGAEPDCSRKPRCCVSTAMPAPSAEQLRPRRPFVPDQKRVARAPSGQRIAAVDSARAESARITAAANDATAAASLIRSRRQNLAPGAWTWLPDRVRRLASFAAGMGDAAGRNVRGAVSRKDLE